MNCWALVPMKRRAEAKSRLAPVLALAPRLALVRSMLAHVLGVLAAAPGADRIAVVSPERDAVPDDILVLGEAGRGLNRALGHAVATLHGLGARQVVIVPGDLPYLAPADVAALLTSLRAGGCALASDERGSGTNAIALDLERLGPIAFRFLFGRNSFARHVRQARALGLSPQVVQRPGLSFDLDEPEALSAFMAAAGRTNALREAS
ncbi:MAG: 2-phospho-L-lactate guanylyltransferase [Alphaproteobacteria bacterium]|nr:2-phospho-L-lactate guanylyltransferase [Alphaproteobacteria bacterium]MDE2012556.1 2-phospho-L-lactate guanylyltransferase [Alphaproteobacteria bacterium]MDE2072937.1 2-phospho-L-lactate guanylyltransferase [Alphaproteobacteria bacterium]